MKTKKWVKVCPRCGSTNVGFDSGEPPIDFCRDCDFRNFRKEPLSKNIFPNTNPNFPEIDQNKVKEFKKQLKKINKK